MYKKIMVVLDERTVSQAAISHGVHVAQVHGADLVFLYLLPDYSYVAVDGVPAVDMTREEFTREATSRASKALREACEAAEVCGVHSFRVICPDASDANSVIKAARLRHCDLIVVGSEERTALMRILAGSIVTDLITRADVPVLVCRLLEKSDMRGFQAGKPARFGAHRRQSLRYDEPMAEDND